MSAQQPSSQRIAVIAYRGIARHVHVDDSHYAAASSVAAYLRKHHRYDGSHNLPAVAEWVEAHEPDFDIQIVQQDSQILSESSQLDDAISKGQFIVISVESDQPSSDRYSAWLYQGALDFNAASPVRFGIGSSVYGALQALADQLSATNS